MLSMGSGGPGHKLDGYVFLREFSDVRRPPSPEWHRVVFSERVDTTQKKGLREIRRPWVLEFGFGKRDNGGDTSDPSVSETVGGHVDVPQYIRSRLGALQIPYPLKTGVARLNTGSGPEPPFDNATTLSLCVYTRIHSQSSYSYLSSTNIIIERSPHRDTQPLLNKKPLQFYYMWNLYLFFI